MDLQNKYVLSFDVGIKNLAFCLLEIDIKKKNEIILNENKLYEIVNIIDWGIINNVEDVSLNVLMIYLALFIPIIFRYKISKPKQS